VLLGIPLLADTVDRYVKISWKKHPLSCYTNCITEYMSVKLAQKPLNTIEIANPTIH